MAIPKSCPRKLPDTDKRSLLARDSFARHSSDARRYKSDLKEALRREKANYDGINSRIDELDHMEQQLRDHDRARIHLTRDKRKL